VFQPAWVWGVLGVFLLGVGDGGAGAVEDDEARAGGALVDRADKIAHFSSS
jgi:hypothetical protein